jgi:hypothetical protein
MSFLPDHLHFFLVWVWNDGMMVWTERMLIFVKRIHAYFVSNKKWLQQVATGYTLYPLSAHDVQPRNDMPSPSRTKFTRGKKMMMPQLTTTCKQSEKVLPASDGWIVKAFCHSLICMEKDGCV